jgi:hypothetical protein
MNACGFALGFLLAGGSVAADEALDKKVAGLLPTPDEERWLAVGWEPNVMKARAEAQKAGKPIFIWIMDGNVLGCT